MQTDEQWLDFARHNGQTTYHVVGTCKMGQDRMAVVDDQLRVHGIGGLRVIDASIMPTMVSGNTNAAVIMIAEKGADHGVPSGASVRSGSRVAGGLICYCVRNTPQLVRPDSRQSSSAALA